MFKYIVFLFILSQLNALENLSNIKPNNRTNPCKKLKLITYPSKKQTIKKIVQIKNFNDLMKELNIKSNTLDFKNKNIKKLLNNKNINDYTITYLIYVKVTSFERKLQKTIKECNDTYVNNIEIGGEFIALIHIKTKSINDYKRLEKVKLNWENLEKIENIADSHTVTFKNILTSNENILPANELKTLILNARNFSKDIIHHEVPYKIHIANNTIDTNETKIDIYLNALQTMNNLEYIRRNPIEFKKENNETTPTIISNKIRLLLNQKRIEEANKIIKQVAYPKRFNAYNKNITTEIEKINLPAKKIIQKYPKILDESNISVNYNFNIEIENNGKVILLTWTKSVKVEDKIIHNEQNSKILFDSYVNYKNLKATQIKSNNIGSIEFNTKFNAYEKNRTINGNGIIEYANCGYKIIDQNGTLKIGCENIKLKYIDIEFEHME